MDRETVGRLIARRVQEHKYPNPLDKLPPEEGMSITKRQSAERN
jgi:hypothetical protein